MWIVQLVPMWTLLTFLITYSVTYISICLMIWPQHLLQRSIVSDELSLHGFIQTFPSSTAKRKWSVNSGWLDHVCQNELFPSSWLNSSCVHLSYYWKPVFQSVSRHIEPSSGQFHDRKWASAAVSVSCETDSVYLKRKRFHPCGAQASWNSLTKPCGMHAETSH